MPSTGTIIAVVIALLLLLLGLAFADVLQAIRDTGWREHKWARRHAYGLLEAYAEAEENGERVLDVANFTDTTTNDGMRRSASIKRWANVVAVVGLLALGLWLTAVWWLFVLLAWAVLVTGSVSTGQARLLYDGASPSVAGSPRSHAVRLIGVALHLAAALLWELAGFASNRAELGVSLLLLTAGLACAIAAALAAVESRRLRALNRSARFGDDATKNSVLFLRSFSDDSLRLRTPMSAAGPFSMLLGGGLRFEELVGSVIDNVAPLVAIGRPGERLPRLGAARTYVPDHAWQDAVERTARRSAAIILVAGSSAGLGWELDHLCERGLLTKSIVIVPPVAPEQALERLDLVFTQLGLPSATPETLRWLMPVLRSLVGIGFSESAQPVFYVADGRDWLSYFGVVLYFRQIVTGNTEPMPHGVIARAVRGAQAKGRGQTS